MRHEHCTHTYGKSILSISKVAENNIKLTISEDDGYGKTPQATVSFTLNFPRNAAGSYIDMDVAVSSASTVVVNACFHALHANTVGVLHSGRLSVGNFAADYFVKVTAEQDTSIFDIYFTKKGGYVDEYYLHIRFVAGEYPYSQIMWR